MHLGGGQAQVGGDVPACEGGRFPVQANAAEGKSRSFGGEPGDDEWSVGEGGDAVDQSAAHSVRYGVYGEAVQRKETYRTGLRRDANLLVVLVGVVRPRRGHR